MAGGEAAALLRALAGREHALLVGRAAAGIEAALAVIGARGQPVMLPANCCYIVLWAVLRSGAQPVLVDVSPDSGCISAHTLARSGVERAAALVVCHMYGLGAPMGEAAAWARARGIFLIEDAALALGAVVEGRPAGGWGDAAVFSFGAGKIVDARGGGALLVDDPRLAAEAARAHALMPPWNDDLARRAQQWDQLYWALHQFEGENPALAGLYPALFKLYGGLTAHRLPAGVGARLTRGLRRLPQNLQRRAEIAALYDELLQRCPAWTLARPPGSILWRYPLLVNARRRDDLLRHLWARGFHDATRWYPPLRPMASALTGGHVLPPTPGAERLGAEIINLPVDAGVSARAARRAVRVIEKFLA